MEVNYGKAAVGKTIEDVMKEALAEKTGAGCEHKPAAETPGKPEDSPGKPGVGSCAKKRRRHRLSGIASLDSVPAVRFSSCDSIPVWSASSSVRFLFGSVPVGIGSCDSGSGRFRSPAVPAVSGQLVQ
eukprot:2377184-Lingulodinium_polyedra.AAC.1